jgi:periplasmic protein TonB
MKYRIPAFLALAAALHAAVLAAVVGKVSSGRVPESAAPVVAVRLSPADAGPTAAAGRSVEPPQPAEPPAVATRATAGEPVRLADPIERIEPMPAPSQPVVAPAPRPSAPAATARASETKARPPDGNASQRAPRPASVGQNASDKPVALATTTGSSAAAEAADVLPAAASEGTALAAALPAPAPPRTLPRVDASWHGNTPPTYPLRARRSGEQGEVMLDVHVDEQGRVTEVLLKQSSGSAMLDRAAISAVRDWRFQPATIGGEPVADWYRDWRWVFRLAG